LSLMLVDRKAHERPKNEKKTEHNRSNTRYVALPAIAFIPSGIIH